jgi:hypothetical protein
LKIFVYETRAILLLSAADGSTTTSMTMARENGAWKLGGNRAAHHKLPQRNILARDCCDRPGHSN